MRRSLAVYRQDVLDAIDAIESFCQEFSFESYEDNLLVRSAVERQFEIIGEAMRQMEEFFPGSLDGISHGPQARAVRNRLAHGYFTIDQGVLWQAVQKDLPVLRAEIEALLLCGVPPAHGT